MNAGISLETRRLQTQQTGVFRHKSQKCFCLPGTDYRHTNAESVFVSLEFSVVAASQLSLDSSSCLNRVPEIHLFTFLDTLNIFFVIFFNLGVSVDFLSSS